MTCLRGKSSLAQRQVPVEMRKDDFPFSRIPDTQFQQWDNQLRESPLALKAFFAQHRPLMTMQPEPQNSTDARDVMFVHVWQPKGVSLHETGFQAVPQEIASEMGPFHVARAARHPAYPQMAPASIPNHPAQVKGRDQVHTIQETIGLIGSILDRYNNQGKGRLMHMPLLDVDVVEDIYDNEEVDATSVRRKRKLKMNRHKYRKRLKAQRTQRRRLSK